MFRVACRVRKVSLLLYCGNQNVVRYSSLSGSIVDAPIQHLEPLAETEAAIRTTWGPVPAPTAPPKSYVKRDAAELYFSRNSELLSVEYEHEKKMVHDRLTNWSSDMLVEEGYALIGLLASPKGTLFQDKIVRFSSEDDLALGNHRFNTGDTVKISSTYSKRHRGRHTDNHGPLSSAIDGIVLERRAWYVDVCVSQDVFEENEWDGIFRLDSYVNKISYERMVSGLEQLTASLTRDKDTASTLDRLYLPCPWLRDLILLSYPDSILRLATSRGGLGMALPALHSSADNTSPTLEGGAALTASESRSEDCAMSSTPILHSSVQLQTLAGLQPSLSSGGGRAPSEWHLDNALDDLRIMLDSREQAQLNASQTAALREALGPSPVTLIQGPPGTGKTKTAHCLIRVMVLLKEMQHVLREKAPATHSGGHSGGLTSKILACAHTHVAADNLLEGIADLDVKVVRIGRPANVRRSLWAHTLDAQLQQHPAWAEQRERLDRAVKRLHKAKDAEKFDRDRVDQRKDSVDKEKHALERVEEMCIAEILSGADVVVATCIGAGAEVLRRFTAKHKQFFRTVLVDEAAQCTEQAVLPTLAYGCDKLILIGDQNQLPPVVLSPAAAAGGLGVSMFARLIAAGLTPSLLTEQYRMHPAIAQFSSREFYQDRVVSRTQHLLTETPPGGMVWPHPRIPIAFVNVSHVSTPFVLGDDAAGADPTEESHEGYVNSITAAADGDVRDGTIHSDSGTTQPADTCTNTAPQNGDQGDGGYEAVPSRTNRSYHNLQEAAAVEMLVEDLLSTGELSLADIGVISPYNAQVKELTERFRTRGWLNDPRGRGRGSSSSSSGEYAEHSEEEIEVSSVDGFQGREKEIILISAVRSNRAGKVGFLKDWRRLNVAITRARRGLVVVGDAYTLQQDLYWRAFMAHCIELGCFRDGRVSRRDFA